MTLVPNPKAHYRNLFGAFKTIIKTEKPPVLFRGISVVAMGAVPAHALYFSAYEFTKRKMSHSYSNIASQGRCDFVVGMVYVCVGVAAAIATLLHDGCMNPIEGTTYMCMYMCVSK